MDWTVEKHFKRKLNLKDPILVEGLPGIGNVGKVATDFMIDELKAKKIADFFSYTMPHSVFVNEKNLVELPRIELFVKKYNGRKRDLLLLTGDVQPVDEEASYKFSESVLELCEELGCFEIVTLGGIGLTSEPAKPNVYCTANSKKIVQRYKKGTSLKDKLYGVVGPIVGVSGLLVGLSKKKEKEAICILAETFGHPMYLGVKGAKEILRILNKRFSMKLNLKLLDKEIREMEQEMMKKTEELSSISKQTAMKKFKDKFSDMNYIG